jgi:uncharacterized membrane protein YecN with MAPEG domain
MTLPVTALYTALFLALMVGLSINVVRMRMREGVSLGDGDNKPLRQAIRVHGNAAEHIPFFLIGLGALESLSASTPALLLYGAVFFLARLAHVAGLSRQRTVNPLRQGGVLLSWLIMLALAIHLLILAVPRI